MKRLLKINIILRIRINIFALIELYVELCKLIVDRTPIYKYNYDCVYREHVPP